MDKKFEWVYRIVSLLFIAESIFLLIAIKFGVVSYGVDVQTPLMGVVITFGLIILTLLLFAFKKIQSIAKKIMAILLMLLMLYTGSVYLTDSFRIV